LSPVNASPNYAIYHEDDEEDKYDHQAEDRDFARRPLLTQPDSQELEEEEEYNSF